MVKGNACKLLKQLQRAVSSLAESVKVIKEQLDSNQVAPLRAPVDVTIADLAGYITEGLREHRGEMPNSKVIKDEVHYSVRQEFTKFLKIVLKNFLPE